jgi:hypothetical protein
LFFCIFISQLCVNSQYYTIIFIYIQLICLLYSRWQLSYNAPGSTHNRDPLSLPQWLTIEFPQRVCVNSVLLDWDGAAFASTLYVSRSTSQMRCFPLIFLMFVRSRRVPTTSVDPCRFYGIFKSSLVNDVPLSPNTGTNRGHHRRAGRPGPHGASCHSRPFLAGMSLSFVCDCPLLLCSSCFRFSTFDVYVLRNPACLRLRMRSLRLRTRHTAIAAPHSAFGLWPMAALLAPACGACRCGAGQQCERTLGYFSLCIYIEP